MLINLDIYFLEKFYFIFLYDLLFRYIYGFVWRVQRLLLFFSYFYFHFILFFFKFNSIIQLNSLIDMVAVDFPHYLQARFNVTYSFISYNFYFRFFFKIFTNFSYVLPSCSFFFSSGVWLERELWDLFGIKFFLHFDLRRILTDYGFFGFPLRKDFPLLGFFELRYDDVLQSVLTEPIELAQHFRFFKFENPWVF